jgi:hypothetical protein
MKVLKPLLGLKKAATVARSEKKGQVVLQCGMGLLSCHPQSGQQSDELSGGCVHRNGS